MKYFSVCRWLSVRGVSQLCSIKNWMMVNRAKWEPALGPCIKSSRASNWLEADPILFYGVLYYTYDSHLKTYSKKLKIVMTKTMHLWSEHCTYPTAYAWLYNLKQFLELNRNMLYGVDFCIFSTDKSYI